MIFINCSWFSQKVLLNNGVMITNDDKNIHIVCLLQSKVKYT